MNIDQFNDSTINFFFVHIVFTKFTWSVREHNNIYYMDSHLLYLPRKLQHPSLIIHISPYLTISYHSFYAQTYYYIGLAELFLHIYKIHSERTSGTFKHFWNKIVIFSYIWNKIVIFHTDFVHMLYSICCTVYSICCIIFVLQYLLYSICH